MKSRVSQENKPTYIVASCKMWHKKSYNNLKDCIDGRWHYVSDPSELKNKIKLERPTYIFFLHWNWIVPDTIIQDFECVCFHMTDVPYGRGGSPLQNLILAGHKTTMLTALRMVNQIDAGPVYCKKLLTLDGSAEEIYLRAGILSFEIIKWMISYSPVPKPQEGEVFEFTRRKPEESILPNYNDLTKVYDFIRMLDADGYPHAFIEHGNYKLIFRAAKIEGEAIKAQVEIEIKTQADRNENTY